MAIEPLGRNFRENLIDIQNVSFTKIHLNISSAKLRSSCQGRYDRVRTPMSDCIPQSIIAVIIHPCPNQNVSYLLVEKPFILVIVPMSEDSCIYLSWLRFFFQFVMILCCSLINMHTTHIVLATVNKSWHTADGNFKYCQTSSIIHTRIAKLNAFRLVLKLSLSNLLKPHDKSRMKMKLEQRRQAMLQLHLSDQQFYAY